MMADPSMDSVLEVVYDLLRQRDYMLVVSKDIAHEVDPIMRLRILSGLEDFLCLVKN